MAKRVRSDEVVCVDAAASRLLDELRALPGVLRAGIALSEGGGRRLRLTSANADRDTREPTVRADADADVSWCHIDAYEDVPLTMVARTGEAVSGTVDSLEQLFPDYVGRVREFAEIRTLLAVPMLVHHQVLGGLMVICDLATVDLDLRTQVDRLAVEAAAELRRAQLGAPRAGNARLGDEPIPTTARAYDCEVAGNPHAVSLARRFLRHALGEAGLDDDLVDTAVLCLSEIVTNAVIHTCASSQLRVMVEPGVVTVTVRDQGTGGAPRPDRDSDDDPLRVHGRGLQLVDALAARWGSDLDAVGTTVWFVVETG